MFQAVFFLVKCAVSHAKGATPFLLSVTTVGQFVI
jgi:hypothetical protein